MSGSLVPLGPWPGGLNLRDTPSLIKPTELTRAINVDVLDDGTLQSREGLGSVLNNVASASRKITKSLGNVIDPANSGYITGIFVGKGTDLQNIVFWDFLDPNTPFINRQTNITSAIAANLYAVVVYNGIFYWLSTVAGGSYTSTTIGGVLTSAPNIPAGLQAFLYKDRLFIINSSARVLYSKATDPTVWSSPDGGFFDLDPGIAKPINCFAIEQNNLLFFKSDKSWIFSYSSDPGLDGTLRVFSQSQGAIRSLAYKGTTYLLAHNGVYRVQSNQLVNIAQKLGVLFPFNPNVAANFGYVNFFAINNILVYTDNSDNTYACNLNTGAWSEYRIDPRGSTGTPDWGFEATYIGAAPTGCLILTTKSSLTLAPSARLYEGRGLIEPIDQYSLRGTGALAPIIVRTKELTFNNSETWKRLFYWTVDITVEALSTAPVRAKVFTDKGNELTGIFTGTIPLDTNGKFLIAKALRFKRLFFELSTHPNDLDRVGDGTVNDFDVMVRIEGVTKAALKLRNISANLKLTSSDAGTPATNGLA